MCMVSIQNPSWILLHSAAPQILPLTDVVCDTNVCIVLNCIAASWTPFNFGIPYCKTQMPPLALNAVTDRAESPRHIQWKCCSNTLALVSPMPGTVCSVIRTDSSVVASFGRRRNSFLRGDISMFTWDDKTKFKFRTESFAIQQKHSNYIHRFQKNKNAQLSK